MITVVLVILCIIFYFTELYTVAFWIVIFAIANSALAMVRAIINPDWYYNERTKAGLNVDFFNLDKHISRLIIVKIVSISILSYIALVLGQKAGYF